MHYAFLLFGIGCLLTMFGVQTETMTLLDIGLGFQLAGLVVAVIAAFKMMKANLNLRKLKPHYAAQEKKARLSDAGNDDTVWGNTEGENKHTT